MVAGNQDERVRLHVLASLICAGVMVHIDEGQSYAYLGSLEGRVVYNAHEKDHAYNQ